MGDRFVGTSIPFPNTIGNVDQAPPPDFHITSLMHQKPGLHTPIQLQRPHSLRWLEVSPHDSDSVRFPSSASATSSCHRPDFVRGDAAPLSDRSPDLAPGVYDHRMAKRLSGLRLGRPFSSRKRSADVISMDSTPSLPSSPVTPNTPIFAPPPIIADLTDTPFLFDGLYSEIAQLASARGYSKPGNSLIDDRPRGPPARLRRKSRDSRDLRGESELGQPAAFSPGLDLTLQQLQVAHDLDVFDQEGKKVRFGDLWRAQRTCVIFIRNFLCPFCMDYMRSLADLADPEALGKAGVKLVVISNGSPAIIKSYKSIFGFPFPVYTDPSCALYRSLGMTLRTTNGGPESERGDYIEHGLTSGLAMVMKNAVKARMPLHRNTGDAKQLGGEYIMGPGLRCSFVSRMRNTRSHAPVRDLLAAAGVELDLQSETQSQVYFDAEEQWMRDRDAELKKIHARKGRRRGFVGERRSGSNEFDNGSTEACPMPRYRDSVPAFGYIKEHPAAFS